MPIQTLCATHAPACNCIPIHCLPPVSTWAVMLETERFFIQSAIVAQTSSTPHSNVGALRRISNRSTANESHSSGSIFLSLLSPSLSPAAREAVTHYIIRLNAVIIDDLYYLLPYRLSAAILPIFIRTAGGTWLICLILSISATSATLINLWHKYYWVK
jgi:hypothetical protein